MLSVESVKVRNPLKEVVQKEEKCFILWQEYSSMVWASWLNEAESIFNGLYAPHPPKGMIR